MLRSIASGVGTPSSQVMTSYCRTPIWRFFTRTPLLGRFGRTTRKAELPPPPTAPRPASSIIAEADAAAGRMAVPVAAKRAVAAEYAPARSRSNPNRSRLFDHGPLSAMQRQSLLHSSATFAHELRLLAFPKVAAEHYTTRSSASAAAEHARTDSYKDLETVLKHIDA